MAYQKLSRSFGLGFFIAKSPSVADPAALYKYMISAHLGFWGWFKSWTKGIGVQ